MDILEQQHLQTSEDRWLGIPRRKLPNLQLSSKKGLRKRGYIGKKGIGFKSVFLITSQPYIFGSNSIRHSKRLWFVYSSTNHYTGVTIKGREAQTVKPVKDQLSSILPEVVEEGQGMVVWNNVWLRQAKAS
ncbi:hypothetical protein M8C21_014966, partial [Ambrosia artemisiifolia]